MISEYDKLYTKKGVCCENDIFLFFDKYDLDSLINE